jgi:hypothetical protein
MPLNFKPQSRSAIDMDTGIVIHTPRMLPASPPENPDHTEYQYMFWRNSEIIGALAVFVSSMMVEKPGHKEQVFMLDLGRNLALDSMLRFKNALNNDDDEFTFLQGLAHGLVAVFENRYWVAYDLRYVAVTKLALLAEHGVAVPAGVELVPTGMMPLAQNEIVLAEVTVPARAMPKTLNSKAVL